jgi:plastocyanin
MRSRSTRSIVLAALSRCLALGLLTVPAVSPAWAADHVVGASGMEFSPSTLTIQAGDTVTWMNFGGSHNVAADDGSFRCSNGCDDTGGNGAISGASWTFTRTFNTPGTIGFHCQNHGSPGAGMFGTITVQAAPPPPTPGTLRFSQSAYSVSEGTANATITVSRVSGDDGAASVAWQAAAGTATAGSDFTAASGVLNWADKDDGNKTFQVHIINDTTAEPSETVLLTLSNATGASLDDSRKSATLTILDNDSGGGTVPPAPTGLTAAAVSTSEIDLSWHDVTGETAYHVEKKQLGGSYQEIGTVGAGVTTFAATGLDEATFSSFRVRAENGAGFSPYSNEAGAATNATVAPCAPSDTVLCLNNSRFAAHVHWRTSTASGEGTTVPLASAPDSGLFYFFSPTNIEMLIKVLNGCPLTAPPPAYWVFFAATTNVELTLTVTDTQTGKVKVYFNPLNTSAPPVQDVSAFATCP